MNWIPIAGWIIVVLVWFWAWRDIVRMRKRMATDRLAHYRWQRAFNRALRKEGVQVDDYDGVPDDAAEILKIEEAIFQPAD